MMNVLSMNLPNLITGNSDVITIINGFLFLLAGVAIMLFGIGLMSDSLRDVAGTRFKRLIEKSTNSLIKGVLVGTLVTALLHSSAGVTALTIGLVRAGLMTFPQSIGIIMGANIGTTFTGVLAAIDISKYAIIIVFLGFIITLFRPKKVKLVGWAIFGMGLLFLGLQFMSSSVKTIFSNDTLSNIMHFFDAETNPAKALAGTGVGTLLTFVLQSSTSFMVVLQEIYANGTISIFGAIPLMLGANIGTTFTAIIASAGAGPEAKKTGVVHVVFNVVGVIPFLIAYWPFAKLMELIERYILRSDSPLALTIAISNTIQNVLSTVILFFMPKQLIWITNKFVKKKNGSSENHLEFNDALVQEPHLALAFVKKVLLLTLDTVGEYFSLTKSLLNPNNKDLLEINEKEHLEGPAAAKALAKTTKDAESESEALEMIIDNYEKRTHDYLIKISASGVSESEALLVSLYSDNNKDLERIGDHLNNIVAFFLEIYNAKQTIPEEELHELQNMFNILEDILNNIKNAQTSGVIDALEAALKAEDEIDKLEKQYKLAHIERMQNKTKLEHIDENYSEILSNLERIGDHLHNIAQALYDPREIYQPR
ncbi:MAG: Na/Pi cotransporter family protein [Acholeplasmatales bacterium]|jgi:phosphate:Na+ symporter|nr:Na/Pi cotransporter family protein [Acholeplasmatales bacterium]